MATPPPADQAEIEQWLAQFAAAYAALEAGNAAATLDAFEQIEDWFDPAQTIAAVLVALEARGAARDTLGGLTVEYLDRVTAILGRPSAGNSIALLRDLLGRQGADPFNVYGRPVFTYRDAIAQGLTPAEAFAAARRRSDLISATDMLLGMREISAKLLAEIGVAGYRRVIRPELSRSGTCGLCIAAADRVYKTDELMPIHDRCKCVILPIVGNLDPGFRTNSDDLGRLYEAAGSTKAADLKRTRFRVEQHGELGPVLVNAAHQPHTGPASLAERSRRARNLLERMLPILADMQANPGRYPANRRAYQRNRVAQLRRIADAA